MAYEFYVTVEGTKQGKLKGESDREAHADKLTGLSFHYSVGSPRDAASGMATGRRTHQPVSFVKEWGAATPQLSQALTTNESFKSVLFEFVKTERQRRGARLPHDQAGQRADHRDRAVRRAGTPGSQAGDTGPLEKISFTFQRIEIENIDGQTIGSRRAGAAQR